MSSSSKRLNIQDALGVDFGTTSTKIVRLRRNGSTYTLSEADVAEPYTLDATAKEKLTLPKKLQTRYAGACITSPSSNVRFLYVSSKLKGDQAIQGRVRKSLGLDNDYRIGYSIVQEGKEGTDHKVLAAGVPVPDVQGARQLFQSNNPSLVSLEIAGLASLNSFSHTDAAQTDAGAVCYIEAGATTTTLSFFHEGENRLVRKLDVGAIHIQQRIQDVLAISEEDALNVLFEDATPLLESSLDPIGGLLQEVSISQKFIERNDNTKVVKVYASGGLSYSPYWSYVMEQALQCEIEIWNPFKANGIKNYPKGVIGVESMFAAAIGSAIAVLRPS